MRQHSQTCAECLRRQDEIGSASSGYKSRSTTCFAGLCETAVPLYTGENFIGFLRTGQIALRQPTSEKLVAITNQIDRWGISIDPARLKAAYFRSPVLRPRQYVGVIRLLEIFAAQLSRQAAKVLTWASPDDSPLSRRAKAYVKEHLSEPIPLDQIARALHLEIHSFCRMFKKATGLTFTNYVGNARVEQARQLLLDPHLQIAEIAYSVGFGSLTHFNRVFRRIVGCSPTIYRMQFKGLALH